MPSNRCLQSPPGRAGSLARGSCNFLKGMPNTYTSFPFKYPCFYFHVWLTEFMTREHGKITGERTSLVRDASSFELWTSLFADDCVLLFQSRGELIRGSSHIYTRLRKFGLCMHVGRGDAASKTEAMYFPPPRTAYEAADTSRFYIDGTGFIDFCEKFKYLGSIPHYSLSCNADVDKRIASATAAFGALKNIFTDK